MGQRRGGWPRRAKAQVQPGAALLGSAGTADDPEALDIALTTGSGDPVEVAAAGVYTLVVDDRSKTAILRPDR